MEASVERQSLKGTYGAHPFGTAESVDIHAALRSYTAWGARQLFLEDRIGSLEIGKEADIVLLRADRINVWPLNNAPSAVVNIMNAGHVDTVFVRGKIKKWRGNLVGVDLPRVLKLIADARDAVLQRSGFQVNLVG